MRTKSSSLGVCGLLTVGLWSCALETSDEVELGASRATLSPPPESTGCTSSVNSGRQYWVCRNDKTWSAARGRCQAVGLDLAVVGSAAENAHIRARLVTDSWAGGSDQTTEAVWRWEPTGVQFWQGGSNG